MNNKFSVTDSSITMDANMIVERDIYPTYLILGKCLKINLEDCSIERLEGFTTTDEAALEFWKAVELYRPKIAS